MTVWMFFGAILLYCVLLMVFWEIFARYAGRWSR
jgi:hypothetical protein